MFNVRYSVNPANISNRRRRVDPRDGWQLLGLGNPSTLWYASDQSSSLSTFITRYGFAWSKNEQDGGTLVKSSSTWDALPTVNWTGGGANVRLGLRCDQMGTAATSMRSFYFTYAYPIYYPASFSPAIWELTFNSGSGLNRYLNAFWNTVNVGSGIQSLGVNVLATQGRMPLNTLNPTVYRKGLVVITVRPTSPTSADWIYRFRSPAGNYTSNARTITSTSIGGWVNVALGYNPITAASGAGSSNLSYGGCVAWKGVGASDAQMTSILDKWESLYPL